MTFRNGRTLRILGAGALIGGIVLAPAAPAVAHDRVDAHGKIEVSPSGDVTATPTVSGSFAGTEVLGIKSENITSVSLTLTPVATAGGEAVTVNACDLVTEGACGSPSVVFSWTPAALAFNGPYEATATAGHCAIVCVAPSTARVTPIPFRLGIVPRPPSDVQVANGANRTATVSWARNSEPDMLYYALFRKAPGASEFTRVGGDIRQPASGRISFNDTNTADGGVFAYKVLAVRKGLSGDDKTTKTSGPSAERSITVEAPPPVTVATPIPGQPGGPSQAVPAGTGVSISGFLKSQPSAKPAPGPKFLDLPDTGFGRTLPFGTPPPEELEEGEAEAVAPSPLAEDVGSGDEVSLTRPLVPVAAGAILLVLAAQVRLLNRKLKETPPKAVPALGVAAPPAVSEELFSSVDPEDAQSELPEANWSESEWPESEWIEFEAPPVLDSSAGGGSLLAPEPIGQYTEAAASYYEGVPSDDPAPLSTIGSAGLGGLSTAVWRGPAFGDGPSDDHDVVSSAPAEPAADIVVDASGHGQASAGKAGEDAWEEEMIWEVVSPTR